MQLSLSQRLSLGQNLQKEHLTPDDSSQALHKVKR